MQSLKAFQQTYTLNGQFESHLDAVYVVYDVCPKLNRGWIFKWLVLEQFTTKKSQRHELSTDRMAINCA